LTETLRRSPSSKGVRPGSPMTLVRFSIRLRGSRHISDSSLVLLDRVTKSHRSPLCRSGGGEQLELDDSGMVTLFSSKTRTSKIFQDRASR
jgi:hypothetical protein